MKSFTKPSLIINKEKSIDNIKTIKQIADKNKIKLRPHFKTHQSLDIGCWYKNLGIDKITVSSVSMAKYFSYEWDDILIAFPINILEIETLNNFPKKCNLSLLVDNFFVIEYLKKNLFINVNIYIKIDVGYSRAGIQYTDDKDIDSIIKLCSLTKNLNFKGFVSHFGNTYNSKNEKDIVRTFKSSIKKIENLREKYRNYEFSIGDTPSSSLINTYPNYISEIRPGNFIFYDLFQHMIGSCKIEDIALRMICPIVSIYRKRKEILIYGGSVHFSKDYINLNNNICYGYVYDYKDLWNEKNKMGLVKSLSQEHGVVEVKDVNYFRVGDLVSIIPVHSCLTVDKMKDFFIGEEKFSIMS